jgi:hypothetical protein
MESQGPVQQKSILLLLTDKTKLLGDFPFLARGRFMQRVSWARKDSADVEIEILPRINTDGTISIIQLPTYPLTKSLHWGTRPGLPESPGLQAALAATENSPVCRGGSQATDA